MTGVALTKLDGSAKGGIAVAIAYELGLPVKLVGVGEGLDDLRPFDAHDFARALVAHEPRAVGSVLVRRARGALHARVRGLLRADALRRADAALHGRHVGHRPVAVASRTERGSRATSRSAAIAAGSAGIAVVPEQRRNGVGRALMEAVLELAPPTVLLEVIEANEPAIKLYESLGFEKTRVLEVWRVDAPLVEARERCDSRRSGRRTCRGSARTRRCRRTTSASRSTAARCSCAVRTVFQLEARRRGCGRGAALARDGAQLRERPRGRRRERCRSSRRAASSSDRWRRLRSARAAEHGPTSVPLTSAPRG